MVHGAAGSTRTKILTMLYQHQHEYLSGQDISRLIGCSRTAVWKHVRELEHEGYRIDAVQKRGYRLAGTPEGLSEAAVTAGLRTEKLGRSIIFYDSIGSTQKEALRLADEGAADGTLVITNEQTAGRGRMGHNWKSQRGVMVTMSLILRPDLPIDQTPQLTLLTAVAATDTIEEITGLSCGIKWPNDILYHGRKLVGILTELQAEASFVKAVVIGVGINVNADMAEVPDELKKTAASLYSLTGRKYNLAEFVQLFLLHFEHLYQLYLKDGFKSIKPLWEKRAVSLGKHIRVRRPEGRILEGTALGIDDSGVLLLQDGSGTIRKIYSADIEWT
ncbi:biotin--[acetyl-CoA-carboxylase] ligase [Sporolactobacillus vineae]|uniref:biotin--[acetyl-CoA-carboxylase] ligase n=1 Tax=Sporolactobacillus vineae TaxID=444463 RepID=UPI00028894D5|nr:biotin--[acetyl-CoA-carboxylase] ligase [Sporolactobacillus vineae]